MINEKILYVPEVDISVDDGSGINERNFVRSLLDKNVNVLIPKPSDKDVLKDLYGYKNLHITWFLNRRNPFSYLYHLIRKIKNLKKIIKKERIDIVIFRLGLIPIDVFFVKKGMKKRVLLKHLTFLSSSQKQNILLSVFGTIRLLFVNKRLIDGCDTPSYMTKKYIEKYYGLSNIYIAKNGTSKTEIKYLKTEKDKDFIYIGRLSKVRNTEDLLKAFSKSNKTIDIYGFGEMEKITTQYSNKYSNINFKGKVTYDELVQILPKYKFGIDLTYVNTEFGKASYSQKIAQYLSFKLNVIAIRCPDNQFIEECKCGKLYDKENEKLINIISNIEYQDFDSLIIGKYIYSEDIINQLIQFWKQK